MDIAAIIISSLALILSAFTFYWLNLREVKKFYLIRIDKTPNMKPEFALVNGGIKDILITKLECGFEDPDGNGVMYPSQRIEINENDSLLLQAGRSFHCKVSFPEKFTSRFVEGGELVTNSNPPIYSRKMRINIQWVEQNGDSYEKATHISKYGFRENGDICMHSPLQSKYDLYEKP